MKIAVGGDHAGFEAKEEVKKQLKALGHEVIDFGANSTVSSDYPDFAHEVGKAVAGGTAERGVLACGTGIGVCIAANKVPGVRAALAYDVETAKLSRLHNDSNVLCLGGRTMDPELRANMLKVWLDTPFEGGERHVRRIAKMEEVD
jgi:ribose 5-phosphate isomerase B